MTEKKTWWHHETAHTFLLRSGSSYFYSHFVDQNKVKLDDIRVRSSRDRPDRVGFVCLLAVLGLHLLHKGFLQLRLLSGCGSPASHRGGFSSREAQGPYLWHPGLAVSWHLPHQGWNLCPLHWQADSQLLEHQWSPWGWVLAKEGQRILITTVDSKD